MVSIIKQNENQKSVFGKLLSLLFGFIVTQVQFANFRANTHDLASDSFQLLVNVLYLVVNEVEFLGWLRREFRN